MRVVLRRSDGSVASIIPLANGVTAFSYVVAGIAGTTGTASITANATAFTGAAQTATVVTITSGTPLVGALVTTSLTGGTVTVTP